MVMDDFKNFIERVRDAIDICAVMAETGCDYEVGTRQVGGWYYGRVHDSLAANPTTGIYFWGSHVTAAGQRGYTHGKEQGDVFQFLRLYAGLDFYPALEKLAQRAGIEMPQWHRERGEQARRESEQRENLLDLATEWFERRLWENPAALTYARGRGWSDETIRSKTEDGSGRVVARGAALGYSGGSAAAGESLLDFIQQKGLDITTPLAVSLFGMRSGVVAWCQAHGIAPVSKWVEGDRIYGMTDFPRLVYPHRKWGQGVTLYFHSRNLVLEGGRMRSVKHGESAPPMYNPPSVLVGERPLYFNHVFQKSAERIGIVEGHADAVTLGQWGVAGIALGGLGACEQLRRVLCQEKRDAVQDGRVFLALDNDGPGREAVPALGNLLGGMLRILTMER
jgi:hypothetical protein